MSSFEFTVILLAVIIAAFFSAALVVDHVWKPNHNLTQTQVCDDLGYSIVESEKGWFTCYKEVDGVLVDVDYIKTKFGDYLEVVR